MLKKLTLFIFISLLSTTASADLKKDAIEALINQNYITAIPLLQHLAEQGDPNAQYNLAIVYKRGLGVVADTAKSNNYFSNAAHNGLIDGYRKLSVSSIKPVTLTTHINNEIVLEPQQWVRSQNENFYTLQLASSTNAELIKKYFYENSLSGKAGYYKNHREGENWYALIYGAYPSVNAANQAISSLPKDLRKWSPWVRKLKTIQRIMIK